MRLIQKMYYKCDPDANRRGVAVRILLNENAITLDTFDEIRNFFTNAGNNTVTVRRFPLTIQTMHAKTLTIDGKEAFIIGSPFEQGYWDTPDRASLRNRGGGLDLRVLEIDHFTMFVFI